MKVKIFYGRVFDAQNAFNRWAKGKALGKDVIIHTLSFPTPSEGCDDYIAIVVYHPEDPFWDKTGETQ